MAAETANTVKRMEELVASIEAVSRNHHELADGWTASLGGFEAAVAEWDIDQALASLADLNDGFHSSLPFRSLAEFDALMLDPMRQLPL